MASPAHSNGTDPVAATPDPHAAERERMVREQIEARGVRDARVLAALRRVPRHEFMPAERRVSAHEDRPIPIGFAQTISQPYIVACMSEALELSGSERVLEIGTGSGYQSAVLAELAREVYSIEIVEPLGRRAAEDLARLGYGRVHLRIGDGYRGWPEAAPFDAIIATAAPDHIPQPLVDQLAVGGRFVIPVGNDLLRLRKQADGTLARETLLGVNFVPMTGEAEQR